MIVAVLRRKPVQNLAIAHLTLNHTAQNRQ